MKKYIIVITFTVLSHFTSIASNIVETDKLAVKYCKQEYTYTGSRPVCYTGDVNKKMYLERMLELKDGKLNAYYAKDVIKKNISLYERFLKTKKSWKGSDITQKDVKEFGERIKQLKLDLEMIEKSYPTDLKVYDRIKVDIFRPQK